MEEYVFASVVETNGIISQIGGRALRPHNSEQLSSFVTLCCHWAKSVVLEFCVPFEVNNI
jgi:hypothetical protein